LGSGNRKGSAFRAWGRVIFGTSRAVYASIFFKGPARHRGRGIREHVRSELDQCLYHEGLIVVVLPMAESVSDFLSTMYSELSEVQFGLKFSLSSTIAHLPDALRFV